MKIDIEIKISAVSLTSANKERESVKYGKDKGETQK